MGDTEEPVDAPHPSSETAAIKPMTMGAKRRERCIVVEPADGSGVSEVLSGDE
jgi:hypothetical protein